MQAEGVHVHVLVGVGEVILVDEIATMKNEWSNNNQLIWIVVCTHEIIMAIMAYHQSLLK